MTEAEFDGLLRRALIEAIREDCAPILAQAEEGPPPDHSPRYRRRRLKMCNRPFAYYKQATRTVWRKMLHSAACILLVAALAFGAVLTVSPTARAWVQEAVTEWLQTSTWFIFTENPNAGTETGMWKTGYLPEGFEVEKETIGPLVTEVVYQNEEGETIYLTYGFTVEGGAFGVDNEHQGYTELQINAHTAYLMKAREDGDWNNLIWLNEESGIAFKLMSRIDSRKLIHIAETMKLTE